MPNETTQPQQAQEGQYWTPHEKQENYNFSRNLLSVPKQKGVRGFITDMAAASVRADMIAAAKQDPYYDVRSRIMEQSVRAQENEIINSMISRETVLRRQAGWQELRKMIGQRIGTDVYGTPETLGKIYDIASRYPIDPKMLEPLVQRVRNSIRNKDLRNRLGPPVGGSVDSSGAWREYYGSRSVGSTETANKKDVEALGEYMAEWQAAKERGDQEAAAAAELKYNAMQSRFETGSQSAAAIAKAAVSYVAARRKYYEDNLIFSNKEIPPNDELLDEFYEIYGDAKKRADDLKAGPKPEPKDDSQPAALPEIGEAFDAWKSKQ